jgi:hypothetical protein
MQQLRLERNKEILNVVCRGKYTPAEDNQFRVNDENIPVSQLPPIATTTITTTTTAAQKPRTSSSNNLDCKNSNQQNKRPQSLNKKDLSTISEPTERSSTTTFIDTRDGTVHRLRSQEYLAAKNQSEYDNVASSQNDNKNLKYKSEAIILKNQFKNDRVLNEQKQNIVPKLGMILLIISSSFFFSLLHVILLALDFHDLSNQSSDIYSNNTISFYDYSSSKFFSFHLFLQILSFFLNR